MQSGFIRIIIIQTKPSLFSHMQKAGFLTTLLRSQFKLHSSLGHLIVNFNVFYSKRKIKEKGSFTTSNFKHPSRHGHMQFYSTSLTYGVK